MCVGGGGGVVSSILEHLETPKSAKIVTCENECMMLNP